jgi:hypothetical protein
VPASSTEREHTSVNWDLVDCRNILFCCCWAIVSDIGEIAQGLLCPGEMDGVEEKHERTGWRL